MTNRTIFSLVIAACLAFSATAFADDHKGHDHDGIVQDDQKGGQKPLFDDSTKTDIKKAVNDDKPKKLKLSDYDFSFGIGPSFGDGGVSGKLSVDWKSLQAFYYIDRAVGVNYGHKVLLGDHVALRPNLGVSVNPEGKDAMSAVKVARKLDVTFGLSADVKLWKNLSVRPGVQWFIPTRIGEDDVSTGAHKVAFRKPRFEVPVHFSF